MKNIDSVKFWVAGHLTTFFCIDDSPSNILEQGSYGAGFNIDKGVITEVNKSSNTNSIHFNGIKQEPGKAKVTETVLHLLEKKVGTLASNLTINHIFEIPMASGYGTSAAGSIGLVLGINKLLELGLDEKILWQIAHESELINTSGLGDVLGLYSKSKFEYRTKAGAPGIGEVQSVHINTKYFNLFVISDGHLSTKSILTNPEHINKINTKGKECVTKFSKKQNLEFFIDLSLEFTNEINLLSPKLKELKEFLHKSYYVSQIMLGNSLFVFVPENETKDFFETYKLYNFIKVNTVSETVKEIKI